MFENVTQLTHSKLNNLLKPSIVINIALLIRIFHIKVKFLPASWQFITHVIMEPFSIINLVNPFNRSVQSLSLNFSGKRAFLCHIWFWSIEFVCRTIIILSNLYFCAWSFLITWYVVLWQRSVLIGLEVQIMKQEQGAHAHTFEKAHCIYEDIEQEIVIFV